MNKPKDEEPLVTVNFVINAPICFKLFECGIRLLNKLYATCERAWMENMKEKYDT